MNGRHLALGSAAIIDAALSRGSRAMPDSTTDPVIPRAIRTLGAAIRRRLVTMGTPDALASAGEFDLDEPGWWGCTAGRADGCVPEGCALERAASEVFRFGPEHAPGGSLKRERRAFERESGLAYLDRGGTRLVARLRPGVVLKIAIDTPGLNQNDDEVEIWGGASKALRETLVPILGHAKPRLSARRAGRTDWLLMAEAIAFGDPRWGDWEHAERMIQDVLAATGASEWERLSVRPGNWGLHEGKAKELDYGAGGL